MSAGGDLGVAPVTGDGEAGHPRAIGDGEQPAVADPGVDRVGGVVVGHRDHRGQQRVRRRVDPLARLLQAAQLGRQQHRLDHARRRVAAILLAPAELALAVDDGERDHPLATAGELPGAIECGGCSGSSPAGARAGAGSEIAIRDVRAGGDRSSPEATRAAATSATATGESWERATGCGSSALIVNPPAATASTTAAARTARRRRGWRRGRPGPALAGPAPALTKALEQIIDLGIDRHAGARRY